MIKELIDRLIRDPFRRALDRDNRHVAQNYKSSSVRMVRGEGAWLWDAAGRKYLDMMSCYSATSHGHGHPRILKALTDQARALAVVSRSYHTKLGPFTDKLCKVTGLDMAIPMNTGAEAVETAIKAARQWGYAVKKIPDGRAEIIVARNNFHGRTTTIVGFSSEEKYRHHFGPFTPGFVSAPFGDIDAIEAAITDNTCAVLVEPIQGEAGIILPPDGFLQNLRKLCSRKNILMVLDEVQSGLGRTGKMFAFEHENARPDILVLGKALGGGVLPVSAAVGTREVMELFTPGSHGSTFGGNPLACAVALEALNVLEDESLPKNAAILGDYMLKQLRSLSSPLIRAVRGRGLWIAIDLDPARAPAALFCERLLARGVLVKETHETTLRLAPPLMITRGDIDAGLALFREVLAEMEAAAGKD